MAYIAQLFFANCRAFDDHMTSKETFQGLMLLNVAKHRKGRYYTMQVASPKVELACASCFDFGTNKNKKKCLQQDTLTLGCFCETCAATKLRDKLHEEVVGLIYTENFEAGFAIVPHVAWQPNHRHSLRFT